MKTCFDKTNWEKTALKDVLIYCDETERDPAKRANSRYISVEHLQTEDFRIENWSDNEMPTFFRKFAKNDVLIALRRVYQRNFALQETWLLLLVGALLNTVATVL